MGKEHSKDVIKFLKPFPKEIKERVLWLRDFIWDLHPAANELIYDNYNALAIGWSPTDRVGHTFCSIAVGRTSLNVHLGFYWGSELSDPRKMLIGEGNQYRYYLVNSKEGFPAPYMIKLIREAYDNALLKVREGKGGKPKGTHQGETITKSVSPVKRSKTKAAKKAKKTRKKVTRRTKR